MIFSVIGILFNIILVIFLIMIAIEYYVSSFCPIHKIKLEEQGYRYKMYCPLCKD